MYWFLLRVGRKYAGYSGSQVWTYGESFPGKMLWDFPKYQNTKPFYKLRVNVTLIQLGVSWPSIDVGSNAPKCITAELLLGQMEHRTHTHTHACRHTHTRMHAGTHTRMHAGTHTHTHAQWQSEPAPKSPDSLLYSFIPALTSPWNTARFKGHSPIHRMWCNIPLCQFGLMLI